MVFHPVRLACAVCLVWWGVLHAPAVCRAGGGPENVLLVVNADDEPSRMVANWYQRLRLIPDSNVVFLRGIPRSHSATLEECREKILQPVFDAIRERKLDGQIDCIVYSTGFPTRIAIPEHSKRFLEMMEKAEGKQNPQVASVFSGTASLTALTFFAVAVINDDPGYLGPNANNYYCKPVGMLVQQPFVGAAQQDYTRAVEEIRNGKGAEAVRLLEPLAQANPLQMMVQYRLAQAWGVAGDARQAEKALIQAIRAGWCYRKHTRDDDLYLKPVAEDPVIRGLIERIPDQPYEFLPTIGFSSRFRWGPGGGINTQPDQGLQYMLCTTLGVIWDEGNSEREIVASLRESAAADSTNPVGTFFFSETPDVRNQTRMPNYESAISRLVAMGHKAEICYSQLPQRADVAGFSFGTPMFSWPTSQSKLLPGAIAENLTSYGGIFDQTSQTTLAELIRYGSAGSSGTVAEPFALQFKFPHPMIHVHYARGCNLAEAYYQSVSGPFQLLVTGDALCQPWARPPQLKTAGLAPLQTVKGPVRVEVSLAEGSPAVSGLEVFLDGKLATRFNSLREVTFDSTKISDGYHELRIVAVDTTPIQTRGRVVIPFQIDNAGQFLRLECKQPAAPVEGSFRLEVRTNVGQSVEILHAGERVGKLDAATGEIEVKAQRLGRGPVEVVAVARDASDRKVSSVPLRLEVQGELAEKPVALKAQE